MKIIGVNQNGPLAGEVRAGDELVAIEGKPISDIIDYYFHQSGEEIEIEIARGDNRFKLLLEKDIDQSLGLDFSPMEPRICGNNCIFCFVDQLPPGVRKSLTIKDEDYRFSFLHGNFITLSNLRHRDLKRIVEYRLSPLYISVHAWDPAVRNRLLGRSKDDRFREKFKALVRAEITLHCQIVVVPGINDSDILRRSITELAKFFPRAASIAIIPVGLTSHRRNLPEIRRSTAKEASEIIGLVDELRAQLVEALNDPLVYCSDEMFLHAGIDLPQSEYYRDFPQIENGVGMARFFLRDIKDEIPHLPRRISSPRKISLITGSAMAPILHKHILPALNRVENLSASVVEVKNRFLGEDFVNVAELLAGRDIVEACKNCEADCYILPPDCLNREGMFIDDMSLNYLLRRLKARVLQYDGSMLNILEASCAN